MYTGCSRDWTDRQEGKQQTGNLRNSKIISRTVNFKLFGKFNYSSESESSRGISGSRSFGDSLYGCNCIDNKNDFEDDLTDKV